MTPLAFNLTQYISLAEGLQAIFFTLGGATLIRWIREYLQRRRQRRSTDTFALGFSVCVILDELRVKLKGHRAVLLRAHNGGKDLSVTRPLYTSVAFQKHDSTMARVHWEKVPVEDDYWHLLQEIHELNGKAFIQNVDDLPEDSALGGLYREHGVRHSFVFMLYATPTDFWYVSVNRKDAAQTVTDSHANESIRVARQKLIQRLRDKRM